MKRSIVVATCITVCFLMILFASFANAQETIKFAWDYNAIEAERVIEWRLYMSDTSGNYTTTPFLVLPKAGNQSTYEETISQSGIPNQVMYFVLTAYGDENFDPRESAHSEEVSHNFSNINAPFNLIITVE